MTIPHAVVWIDHHEAKIFHLTDTDFETAIVRAPAAHVHRHPKGGAEAHAHPADAKRFFDDAARALTDAQEFLVVGPGTAKLEFIKYIHQHAHALEPKLIAVETVDHPTDKALVAYARRYFKAADRMR
jgi:stalled ribosome rescue protein Dom34